MPQLDTLAGSTVRHRGDDTRQVGPGTGRHLRHHDALPSAARVTPSSRMLCLPLLIALTWMLGTFGAFWFTRLAARVPDPGKLCLFVLGATAMFAVGYLFRIHAARPRQVAHTEPSEQLRRVSRLIFWGACYYAAVGLARLAEFGASGPESLVTSIRDPATGYLNKMEVYQLRTEQQSPVIITLALLGALGTVLAPLMVIYWRKISLRLRVAGIAGMALYALFYLYIGTMKGIGDLAVMSAAGLLIMAAGRARRQRRVNRKREMAIAATIFVLVGGYMLHAQTDRATQFESPDRPAPNQTLERLVGREAAGGLTSAVSYPTQGYLGLAYNLETPFEWSDGLGSSPALTNLLERTLQVAPEKHLAYPHRTEELSGWPALMYWATIYPWLASDLTFPGTVLFMGLLGWFFAHCWLRAIYHRRLLAMLIFGQLCILIAYIPANNQLGLASESVAGVTTLLILYAATALGRRSRSALTG
ncbi:hypothetical protein [Micromonospora sp. KC213]|uniref:hypothetical protein n=1 Tax=Micromonospora sp. KC213 TaxID=2530378 RepID=UPI0010456FAB|nr:hypothetical protein [Micromonospora sp. KC213]TDC40829.1 hypothetical protein E1166_14075 [Micromonospora sp. KC213]